MATPQKIYIVGIGDDGLDGITSAGRDVLTTAELVVGSPGSLARIPASKAQRLPIGDDLDALVKSIGSASDKRVCVLASGDPLFYGVARFLCDKLGKDRFEVVPHVSSMQLAFARVKESWEEAYLTNLAGQSIDRVVEKIRTAEKVGLFTSDSLQPNQVAQALLDRKIDYFSAYVCENLGSPDERVTQGELAEVAAEEFSRLNVMILVRKPNVPDRPIERSGKKLFGNPDEAFLQSRPKRGLLTPMEVRTIALAELDLGPTSIVWDIGAGSGSVSIEAAQLVSGGTVFAIEMDPEDHELIASNARSFGVTTLVPVLGKAPEAFEGLPKPDAVFVGGTGREVTRLCEDAYNHLKPGGRLVANVSSIENLSALHELLLRKTTAVQVRMISVAHGTHQLEQLRFEGSNPSFLLSVVKQGK